jgi:predicted O-methyltransferase YrrM
MDIVSPEINDYLLAHSEPADAVLRDLAEQTHRELGGRAVMQISHDEGELLTMLVRLTGARRAVEVGTFTGYSSICIARGLPEDGVETCRTRRPAPSTTTGWKVRACAAPHASANASRPWATAN